MHTIELKKLTNHFLAILDSLLLPKKKYISFNYTETVFIQPITSNRKTKRILIAVEVKNLHKLILKMKEENYVIEHIFDY